MTSQTQKNRDEVDEVKQGAIVPESRGKVKHISKVIIRKGSLLGDDAQPGLIPEKKAG